MINTHIRQQAADSLEELATLIRSLHVSQFTQPLPSLHQNSAGKHARHIIEFFECLDWADHALIVNYDERQRNLRLEEEPEFALHTIARLQERILGYEEKTLSMEFDYGKGKSRICTTLYRELVYNIEHCVHHLAILKIGIESHFPQVYLSPELGVAYSTQQYQKAS